MGLRFINPETLGQPRGYSNGVLAESAGRPLFIAGQVGWDHHQKLVSTDLLEQFEQALRNLLTVVREAGGKPEQVVRLVIYVKDKNEYLRRKREIGERYRALMGKHYPAMVLVEVRGLLEDAAQVEIEGTAIL